MFEGSRGSENCDLRQLGLSNMVGECSFASYGPESQNAGDGFLVEASEQEVGSLITVSVSNARCASTGTLRFAQDRR